MFTDIIKNAKYCNDTHLNKLIQNQLKIDEYFNIMKKDIRRLNYFITHFNQYSNIIIKPLKVAAA